MIFIATLEKSYNRPELGLVPKISNWEYFDLVLHTKWYCIKSNTCVSSVVTSQTSDRFILKNRSTYTKCIITKSNFHAHKTKVTIIAWCGCTRCRQPKKRISASCVAHIHCKLSHTGIASIPQNVVKFACQTCGHCANAIAALGFFFKNAVRQNCRCGSALACHHIGSKLVRVEFL